MDDFLGHPDAYFQVGNFDSETNMWPVYHYVGTNCYGTVAEFRAKRHADEWVTWKHAQRKQEEAR